MNDDEVITKWEKNLVPHARIILVEDAVGSTRRWNVLMVNLNSGRKRKMAKFTEVMRQAKRLCAAHDLTTALGGLHHQRIAAVRVLQQLQHIGFNNRHFHFLLTYFRI